MMRKVKLLVVMLFCLLLVQGCWGAQEIDELGYILVMGIDKGEENIIKVTFQLAIPQPITGGGEGQKATEVISVEAASIFSAQELADAFVSKHLTLIHNNAVIVSEEIAREGLSTYINPLVRSRDFRRTNFLMVAKGKASDFIEKNKLVFEKYPSRQLDIFMASADLTGFICVSDIHSFYQGLKSPGRQPMTGMVAVQKEEEKEKEGEKGKDTEQEEKDKAKEEEKAKEKQKQEQEKEKRKKRSYKEKINEAVAYLPGEIPRTGGNKIDIIGQAVFKADQLVGFLNGKETRYYQMVTGKFGKGVFTFPDPQEPEDNAIVMEIKKERNPEIKINSNEDQTTIEVKLFLEGEILSIQSGINYEMADLEKELEDYISQYISQDVKEMIKKTQEEYQSDIFGFGEYTRTFFLTWDDWVNYKWLEKYPQCEIRVNTVFNIRRTGMMLKTAPTPF